MDDKVLRIVYTFFLGVMLALFAGLGIRTFYAPPEMPEFPVELSVPQSGEPTPEQVQQQREFEQEQRAFQDELEVYNRNVSIASTVSAVAMLVLSLLLEKKNRVITNGIMLGGLFTLLYAVGRGLVSGDATTTFITVTIGLGVVLFLGYRRFVQHIPETEGT
jgi:hypothetical protein